MPDEENENQYWEKQHETVVQHTYYDGSGLRRNNTMHYFKDREDAVRFAAGRLRRLQSGSQLTMTIKVEKSGACSVSTVTDTLSVGTGMDVCCDQPPIT